MLSALSVVALAPAAAAPVYSISSHIVSNGSSVRSSNNCHRLDAIIAEPVVGYSSSATYGLSAGFSYVGNPASDSIFANSFEDCP